MTTPAKMSTSLKIKIIVSIVFAVIALIFIFQNTEVLDLNFLLWTVSMSRSLMILFVLFIGMVAGWFLNSHFQHAKKTGNTANKSTELKTTDNKN